MKYFKEDSLAELYVRMLWHTINNPEYETSPRGQKIKEIIGVQAILTNPYSNSFKNKIRDLPRQYLAKELSLYFAGRNDVKGFIDASSFWDKLKTKWNTIHSAYGYLIFTNFGCLFNDESVSQWEWAKRSLINDKDSRQALMFVSSPEVQYEGCKDFICTLNYAFLIRDNKLHMIVNRRSQDIHFGFTYDAVWESLLMQCMKLELASVYPEIELGNLIFNINSLHVYERNFEILENMLNYGFELDELPRIKKNPILNLDVIGISHGEKYEGNDEFFKWLYENRKG